jgi:hypothetical protein
VEKIEKQVRDEKKESSRLTLNEAAKYAKVSKNKMRQLLKEKRIPCFIFRSSLNRVNGYLVPTETLNDWFSSNGKISYCEMVANFTEREDHHFSVEDKNSFYKNYITMPLKKNLPQGRKGWELNTCQECGNECWLLPQAKDLLEQDSDFYNALCTVCSLKKTF